MSSATEFVILVKNPPFSEISQWVRKCFATWRKFQNKFFVLYVYMINENLSQIPFRPGKHIEGGYFFSKVNVLLMEIFIEKVHDCYNFT